jgi:DUF4097 and DUF4098 domain-containing protein YvlB
VDTRTERFPVTGGTPAIEVRNPAGSVTVEAREGADELVVEVTALDSAAEQLLDRVGLFSTSTRLRVEVPERRLLRTPSFAVTVLTPPGAAVRVATASADATLRGPLGDVEVTSASGDLAVEECARLELRTASGDGRIDTVSGPATAASASGDLHVRSAAAGLKARTASGDISVEEAAGDVSIATASGDLSIGRIGEGSVQAKTMSGDVEVGVVPGLRVWLDLSSVSGRMNSQLPDDDGAAAEGPAQVSLSLRSVSGDLRIRRAAAAG